MRQGNPANYECPKGDGGIHYWAINDAGAKCLNCGLQIGHEDARDLFGLQCFDIRVTAGTK